ncbi:NAD(P)/FAD-dependent oxidoreductase [Athalassotoga saccharophila]|uniref:NAD(P)/FAD-dependent oxidoreductase n=1 Tax=Athalassotoga saccharophila TaxID=1441386 RepID=UPI00137A389D|nr:FAD/NAD(P)-binding oxidoreductase [Athalassotoga saccharophila]BBJ28812.1 NADH peroxidase [Athalassotoga saccharophila]
MKYDVVVVGGGAAGIGFVSTALATYPKKKILMIKKEKDTLVPCGIPYTISTLDKVESDIMSTKGIESAGAEVLNDVVTRIDPKSKKVFTSSGKEFEYDKLVLATGSNPIVPKIPGVDLKNVFTVPKDINQIKNLKEALSNSKKVVVVGAGFIGMEVSDELRRAKKDVTIIEALDRVLPVAFDPEFSEEARKIMENEGIKIKTSSKVKEIVGHGKVEGVLLESGERVDAEVVILSIGYRAESTLAKEAGLSIGISGGIWTDEYMRTSEMDVFAIGDCAEHKDFFTRRANKLMLASVAAFDARIAAANLYNLKLIRQVKGDLSVFSTSVGGFIFAAAGLDETDARNGGFDVEIGIANSVDRHPATIPDTSKVKVKLIFSKSSGVLIGCQMMGGKSVGEMINVVGTAIQGGMTVADLTTLQIGTHPLVTASPVVYPLITAALDAYAKLNCKEK